MTPKEKAQELVYKYINYTTDWDYLIKAKKCALIAVDEIIKYSPNKPDYEFDPIEYFNKVKQEIENL
jgi:hypothetical protein